ncbi:hypothetical protein H9Y13_09320 [Aeromonas veronii]|uniref:hypothetical protein n=1 Tax=Aeromonas TaxID=642 RepID=UPI0022EA150C|nr:MULTISPECIES: hypothetical protein [Aeromonas]KAJ8738356.1 hypothetical protein H9Y13_09320 [Aeromonas veronii]MDA3315930.1 hypothetical protein [Aeromonas sp. PI_26]
MVKKRLYEEDPNWLYETVLLKDEFIAYNNYFYKRVKAHRIVLDTPKAKALAAYTLIEKDLRSCAVWLNAILNILKSDPRHVNANGNLANEDRETYNVVKGLFVAALTIYGKCYTSCEGRRVKLEKSNLDEMYHEIHDEAMSFRHNFAAHSGAKKLETTSVVVVLDSKFNRRNIPRISTELMQPDSWSIKETKDFINLVEHVRKFVKDKISALTDKVYKDDVLSKGKEYWYKKI